MLQKAWCQALEYSVITLIIVQTEYLIAGSQAIPQKRFVLHLGYTGQCREDYGCRIQPPMEQRILWDVFEGILKLTTDSRVDKALQNKLYSCRYSGPSAVNHTYTIIVALD